MCVIVNILSVVSDRMQLRALCLSTKTYESKHGRIDILMVSLLFLSLLTLAVFQLPVAISGVLFEAGKLSINIDVVNGSWTSPSKAIVELEEWLSRQSNKTTKTNYLNNSILANGNSLTC